MDSWELHLNLQFRACMQVQPLVMKADHFTNGGEKNWFAVYTSQFNTPAVDHKISPRHYITTPVQFFEGGRRANGLPSKENI